MIRGPVLPLVREGLRRLLRERADLIERGLQVMLEDLELGTAGVGVVDALLRDAAGAPVLAMITEPQDPALLARTLAAREFWRRNADAMARALPEADLRPGAPCRILVVGTSIQPHVVEALQRLRLDDLDLIELERFHVGDQERLVVRSLCARGSRTLEPIDAAVAGAQRELLGTLDATLQRLDDRVTLDGDRFSRRATWSGRALCEYWFAADQVHGALPGERSCVLRTEADARAFADGAARRWLTLVRAAQGVAATPPAPPRGGFDALRHSLSHARLSREECSALGAVAEEDLLSGS